MVKVRQQLSMYVPLDAAREIEAVRQLVDPLQHSLIPAHITLCREDELATHQGWDERLDSLQAEALHLEFGRAEAFNGHGILLECVTGQHEFRRLREAVLGSHSIREHAPHLTLAHPRNPRAPGNWLANAARLPVPLRLTFPTIHLIEQIDDCPWQILATYDLRADG